MDKGMNHQICLVSHYLKKLKPQLFLTLLDVLVLTPICQKLHDNIFYFRRDLI